MQFTITEKIKTKKERKELVEEVEEVFRKVSAKIIEHKKGFTITGINETFGSINRNDTTELLIKEKESGFMLSADVEYNPSIAFWIFVLISLSTFVGFLIPIGFYFWNKTLVENEIKKCFKNIKDEFED